MSAHIPQTAALPHAYPTWEPPHNDPLSDGLVQVFRGDMRIVRNPKRARQLRKRGVPLWRHGREWVWFVEPSAERLAEMLAGGEQ